MCPAIVFGIVTRDGMVSYWPSRTRTVTRTTFNFTFSRLFSKIDTPESFNALFFTTKVSRLFSVEGG